MADRDDDEATFEALDDASEASVGPPAVLLFGFDRDEASTIGELLKIADLNRVRSLQERDF